LHIVSAALAIVDDDWDSAEDNLLEADRKVLLAHSKDMQNPLDLSVSYRQMHSRSHRILARWNVHSAKMVGMVSSTPTRKATLATGPSGKYGTSSNATTGASSFQIGPRDHQAERPTNQAGNEAQRDAFLRYNNDAEAFSEKMRPPNNTNGTAGEEE
jgi:hypothetical protein